jgi:hypothetical protein
MRTKRELLTGLIRGALELGLSNQDANNAMEYLEHNEYGVCFELIVIQLYEFNIQINRAFYLEVDNVAGKLEFPQENYSFLEKLIK